MKHLIPAIKVMIALFLAKFVGDLIVVRGYEMIIALFVGFLFIFLLPLHWKFVLFSVSAFYPLTFFGNFKFITDPTWIMMIAPVLFLIILIELIIEKKPLYSRNALIFFAAIAVLFLWMIVSYMKNPVLGERFTGAVHAKGGIKAYALIIVGICTFFCSYWYFRYKDFDKKKWLTLLLVLTFVIGVLRTISYFGNFWLPMLGGAFHYLSAEYVEKVNAAHRVGGLDITASLGIPIILSLIYRKRWNPYYALMAISFIIMLIIAGGRGIFVGTLLAIGAYVAIVNKKSLVPVLILLIVVGGGLILTSPDIDFSESKFGRVLKLSEEDIPQRRIEEGALFLKIFLENPIFGKGIGYEEVAVTDDPDAKRFMSRQITGGGHGSYYSILAIFGLGGIFFLSVMLFGGMYYSYNVFKNDKNISDDARLAIFAFLYLIILSMEFVPGGDGYSNMRLHFISGMIPGIVARKGVAQ